MPCAGQDGPSRTLERKTESPPADPDRAAILGRYRSQGVIHGDLPPGQTVQASPIRKFKPYADAAIKAGVKVYFLNIGDPDIPTPKPILDAVRGFNDPS